MHIVLVSPQIPPNTGNVARLCAAAQADLHLVRPLGFVWGDKRMQRAGLDYWDHVNVHIHNSLEACAAALDFGRAYFLTTKTERSYTDVQYHEDDVLIFGNEEHGLPEDLLAQHDKRCLTIPMPGPVRSLNLATSVGIVLFHALQKLSSHNV